MSMLRCRCSEKKERFLHVDAKNPEKSFFLLQAHVDARLEKKEKRKKIWGPAEGPKEKVKKMARRRRAPGKNEENGGAPQARPLFRRRRRRKRRFFGAAGAGKSGRTLCRFSCRLQIFFCSGPMSIVDCKKKEKDMSILHVDCKSFFIIFFF